MGSAAFIAMETLLVSLDMLPLLSRALDHSAVSDVVVTTPESDRDGLGAGAGAGAGAEDTLGFLYIAAVVVVEAGPLLEPAAILAFFQIF